MKLLNNVTKGIISTCIGLFIILLDLFFFLFIRFLGEEPISLTAFITLLVIGLAMFLLDEESLCEWIKKKLNNT